MEVLYKEGKEGRDTRKTRWRKYKGRMGKDEVEQERGVKSWRKRRNMKRTKEMEGSGGNER